MRANPFDLRELIRRTPHGSFFTYQTRFRLTHPVSNILIALGQHTRAGIEDNLWNTTKGERMSTIQMIERHVRMAKELGRAIATPEQARQMLKIGVTYNSMRKRSPTSDCRQTVTRETWASWCTKPMDAIVPRRRVGAGTSTRASGRNS